MVQNQKKDFTHFNDRELLEMANKIMDNLMEASTNKDYERHTRDFSKRIMEFFTKERFLNIVNEYQEEKGYFSSRKFVKLFRRDDSVIVVWEQLFTKVDGEYLAELLIKYEDDKIVCDHVWII